MDNKEYKEPVAVELEEEALKDVSGGTRNYGVIIPDLTSTGNVAASEDSLETMRPVGAIVEP